jgi:hypothetical protein
MRRWTGFVPRHSGHVSDSALCGTCHNLNTPVVDAEGRVVSEITGHEFPEQAVYSEWQQSDFADDGPRPQSCQDCHMRSADGVKMATRPRRLAPVDGFRRHAFGGANNVVLDILNDNREELGVGDQDLEAAMQANREFLRRAAEVGILSAKPAGDYLEVRVEVVNKTGHKLPTGYPSRRVWLDLAVSDGHGRQLFRSGEMNADGSIVGVDTDRSTNDFERHHGVISHPSQVQVYESVMGDTDGAVTHTLLRAEGYLKDNRIPPIGFDKGLASATTAVVGEAFDDADFRGGRDVVTYRIRMTAPAPLRIRVALRYQPLSNAFLGDLFRDSELPLVARLQRYWDQADLRAETLATAQTVVAP